MAELVEPGLGVAAWADLASVRRTIEWVGLDQDRLEKSKFTGATVGRLLRRIVERHAPEGEIVAQLEAMTALMDEFDAADVARRAELVVAMRSALEGLVSIGELGARRHDLEPKARLSKPSRRDRRGRRSKDEGETSEAAASSDDAAEADAVTAAESSEEAASSDDEPTDGAEAQLDGVDGTSEPTEEESAGKDDTPEADADPYAWLSLPKTSPPAPRPRAPRRLEWNHPEGTGMSVGALGVLDQSALSVLAELGMTTVGEFLSHPPKDHIKVRQANLTVPVDGAELGADDLDAAEDGEAVMVRGRVIHRFVRLTANGARYEVRLKNRQDGVIRCTWVGAPPRGWTQWTGGMEVALVGAPEQSDDGWALFEAEPVGVDGRGSGWMPVYGIDGVEDSDLRKVAAAALSRITGRLREPLPRKLVEYHKLIGLDDALRDAHFPSNKAGKGRIRLAFEEFLLLQAGIGWRAKRRNPARGLSHKVLHRAVGELGVQQNISLTDSQEAVFSEIRRDLKSSHAMVRLLQGEVGTDKTTIAMLTAAVVIQNKAQVLYVLPDADSAERRFLFSEGVFRSVGLSPVFVPGSPTRGQLDAISRGEAQVIFGTKALLEKAPKWSKLGLVIVEERNEYGTVDPARLVESGPAPDLLVITDTPIPSSLTLTVFGEYRMSMLSNDYRTHCTSVVFPQAARTDAYQAVREAVDEGRQAFVVFPVGESGDLLGPDDALRYAQALQSEALEGARIGVYCSAMSREDRVRVFEDFQHRRIDVLVATTFIEEAPVVANATVVVVEHADHHELARLHRLRGHVGQGLEPGQCLMVMSEKPSEDAKKRLTQLSAERDGFKIAEMDLKERGWDALLGDGAESPPEFRWADPVLDHRQLLSARDEAFRLVKQDPGMRRNREMVEAVAVRWGPWLGEDFSTEKAEQPQGDGRGKGSNKGRRRRRRRR